MRSARHGLFVGYTLLLIAIIPFFVTRQFFPDLTQRGSGLLWIIFIFLCSAVALAVFGGSVTCAARSLLQEASSRTVVGYSTLFVALVSALALGAVYLRGFVFTR